MKIKKGRAYYNAKEDFVPLQQLLEGVYDPDEIKTFAQDKSAEYFDRRNI